MALTIRNEYFYDTVKDHPLGVFAGKNSVGRWQFRMGDAKGKLIASGITPAEFARTFWYRDDFTETIGR